MSQEITIFSTPSCAYCKMAKEYFNQKGVEYKEIDVVAEPEEGQKMVAKTGQMGVPQIFIKKDGKEEFIIGFDQARLEELLS